MTESKLHIWILAARPKTLWAAIAPVIIGSALAYDRAAFDLLPALAALFGAVMIQIGTNFANDYFDFKCGVDSGERLGPLRVTQAGLVSPNTMKLATAVAFLLATAAGAYLVWHAGWPILVIGLLSILFGVLYTAGPSPLSRNGLAELFVLIFFGPVAVCGTYYVQVLSFGRDAATLAAIIAGLAPGLFSVAILAVNNLRDIDNDRRAGKRTLAVRFGLAFARWEYLIAVVAASSVPIALYLLTEEHRFALLASLTALAAVPMVKTVLSRREGPILNSVLASTGKLLLSYAVLFSIGWVL